MRGSIWGSMLLSCQVSEKPVKLGVSTAFVQGSKCRFSGIMERKQLVFLLWKKEKKET